jgi:hypothetical protein
MSKNECIHFETVIRVVNHTHLIPENLRKYNDDPREYVNLDAVNMLRSTLYRHEEFLKCCTDCSHAERIIK